MKKKILEVYLTIFGLTIFVTSAIFIYEQINKLNLPKGIISAIVNYGYFLIHLVSFSSMLYYGKESFISKEQNE